jgi:hypothetical protein
LSQIKPIIKRQGFKQIHKKSERSLTHPNKKTQIDRQSRRQINRTTISCLDASYFFSWAGEYLFSKFQRHRAVDNDPVFTETYRIGDEA